MLAVRINNLTENKYEFNQVFPENVSPDEIYDTILNPMITDVLQGYNCTLFSYGLMSSGIYDGNISPLSMSASSIRSTSTPKLPLTAIDNSLLNSQIDIIPQTIQNLFNCLHRSTDSFTVRISYLGILNDELMDLLQSSETNTTTSTPLKIYENDKSQVIVNGLTEIAVNNIKEAMDAHKLGKERMRRNMLSATKSHSIFTIMVSIKGKSESSFDDDNEEIYKFSKLNLVQLAGFESTSPNTSIKMQRNKTIQSLASLNRVVQALIDKQCYIPYRDSKLTRILQESFGGNTKTSFIASIGATAHFIEETMQTIEFMTRIRNICNHPQINDRTIKMVSLMDVTNEITRLKLDIDANRNKSGLLLSIDEHDDIQVKLNDCRIELRCKKFEMKRLQDEFNILERDYMESETNLGVLTRKIALLKEMNELKHQQLNKMAYVTKVRDSLIQKFMKTEEQLTEQANQLIVTADEIINDGVQLFDSIDRRQLTQGRFEEANAQFFDELNDNLNEMRNYARNNSTMIERCIETHNNNYGLFHLFIFLCSLVITISIVSFFLFFCLNDFDFTEQFHRMVQMQLKLFKSNVNLMIQKNELNKENVANCIDRINAEAANELKASSIEYENHVSTQFDRFIQVFEKQQKSIDESHDIVKQMVCN